jgi:transposase
LRRLQQHEEAVLAFALVAGVPFTNNQAERDLRPAKVYTRLQGVISTCRKQDRNVFVSVCPSARFLLAGWTVTKNN